MRIISNEHLNSEEDQAEESASRAFYVGMIAVALVSLVFFLTGWEEDKAFLAGLASGWVISVATYAVSTVYYGFKENWGLGNDKE